METRALSMKLVSSHRLSQLGLYHDFYKRNLQLVKKRPSSVAASIHSPCYIRIPRLVYRPLRCSIVMNSGTSSQYAVDAGRSIVIPVEIQCVSSICIIVFAIWGLVPFTRLCRSLVLKKNGHSWKRSTTCSITTSLFRPLLLCIGAALFIRLLDPVGKLDVLVLSTKGRLPAVRYCIMIIIICLGLMAVFFTLAGREHSEWWWPPTIIQCEDGQAIFIPNHNFTATILRKFDLKTHWPVKAQLAISLLDMEKINTIIDDLRKVVAENPHIEQKKLHKRVVFDNVNPENQPLMLKQQEEIERLTPSEDELVSSSSSQIGIKNCKEQQADEIQKSTSLEEESNNNKNGGVNIKSKKHGVALDEVSTRNSGLKKKQEIEKPTPLEDESSKEKNDGVNSEILKPWVTVDEVSIRKGGFQQEEEIEKPTSLEQLADESTPLEKETDNEKNGGVNKRSEKPGVALDKFITWNGGLPKEQDIEKPTPLEFELVSSSSSQIGIKNCEEQQADEIQKSTSLEEESNKEKNGGVNKKSKKHEVALDVVSTRNSGLKKVQEIEKPTPLEGESSKEKNDGVNSEILKPWVPVDDVSTRKGGFQQEEEIEKPTLLEQQADESTPLEEETIKEKNDGVNKRSEKSGVALDEVITWNGGLTKEQEIEKPIPLEEELVSSSSSQIGMKNCKEQRADETQRSTSLEEDSSQEKNGRVIKVSEKSGVSLDEVSTLNAVLKKEQEIEKPTPLEDELVSSSNQKDLL